MRRRLHGLGVFTGTFHTCSGKSNLFCLWHCGCSRTLGATRLLVGLYGGGYVRSTGSWIRSRFEDKDSRSHPRRAAFLRDLVLEMVGGTSHSKFAAPIFEVSHQTYYYPFDISGSWYVHDMIELHRWSERFVWKPGKNRL